jgi:hypothetical protein
VVEHGGRLVHEEIFYLHSRRSRTKRVLLSGAVCGRSVHLADKEVVLDSNEPLLVVDQLLRGAIDAEVDLTQRRLFCSPMDVAPYLGRYLWCGGEPDVGGTPRQSIQLHDRRTYRMYSPVAIQPIDLLHQVKEGQNGIALG